MRTAKLLSAAVLPLALVLACSSGTDGTTAGAGGSGGGMLDGSPTGGMTGAGGSAATGGSAAAGGSAATGGVGGGTGGTSGAGGNSGAGGSGTGGAGAGGSAGGGAAGAGGAAGFAGASGNGGTPGTGGGIATGGSAGAAGNGGAGGSPGTGGAAGSGGVAGTAGTGGMGGTAGSSGMAGAAGSGGSAGTAGGGMAGAAGSAGTGGMAGTGGTPGGNVIKLIAIGDTGEGNTDQNLIADQMDAKCAAVGGCTAVIMNGDNFYNNGVQSTDDPQWGPKFEQAYDRPNLNGLKFYATLGNHDYGLTSSGVAQAQIDYSTLPVGSGPGTRASDKWVMHDFWYDVSFGDVHIFSMDTQDGSQAQINDMTARVAASTATWKIVFGHHPRFTSGDHNKDNWLVNLVTGYYSAAEAIYCGADFYLTGHDHNVEWIDAGRDPNCPTTHFVISGAGAKLRSSGGVVRAQDGPADKQLFYDETVEAFAYFEFDGVNLHFEFIDKNGQVMFMRDLQK